MALNRPLHGPCMALSRLSRLIIARRGRHSRSPSLLISGSVALSVAFAAETIKNLPLALRVREKI